MKRSMGIIKEKIRAKTLRNLENIKQYHTKVKDIEHNEIKIQKLSPSNLMQDVKRRGSNYIQTKMQSSKSKKQFKRNV